MLKAWSRTCAALLAAFCAALPVRASIPRHSPDATAVALLATPDHTERVGEWLIRDPLGEAGGINLTAFCGNDPINEVDPLGLKTCVVVNDAIGSTGGSITLNMMLRYVPASDESITSDELHKLAQSHEQLAEGLFGTYTYGGQNAPLYNKKVKRNTGMPGEYLEVIEEPSPKYKGYRVRLNVIITTEPVPEGLFWEDPYDTFYIGRKAGKNDYNHLFMDTPAHTVFHEYFHHLNLWDEYDTSIHGDGRANMRALYEKVWGKEPESDCVMANEGVAIYDRYIEAAVFDIENISRTKRRSLRDDTFELDPSDPYISRLARKQPDLLDKLRHIIEGAQ